MIYKYQIQHTEYTTLRFNHPLEPSSHLPPETSCTELATVDGWSYVHVPDGVELPEQSVTLEAVELTADLLSQIKAVSPHVRLINRRVVDRVRSRFTQEDEFKLNRMATGAIMGRYVLSAEEVAEIEAFEVHVLASRDQGRQEKAAIGLTLIP